MEALQTTEHQELLLLLWAGLGLKASRAQLSPHTGEHGAGRAARSVGFLMDFGFCQVKDLRKYKYLSTGGQYLGHQIMSSIILTLTP